jgi:hypothetical protein
MTRFIEHFDTVRDYTLPFTITYYLLLPTDTTLLPLFDSSFQRRTFRVLRLSNCPRPQLLASNSNSSQRLNPNSILTTTEFEVKILSWPTVSFGVSTHLGPKIRFLLLSESCEFIDVGCILWREDGSVVYNSCWPSPEQSFLGPSPEGLMTIFHCIGFKTLSTLRAGWPYLHPPGRGWASCTIYLSICLYVCLSVCLSLCLCSKICT